jgi:membrane protein implicated in regulation of membrane protease activity
MLSIFNEITAHPWAPWVIASIVSAIIEVTVPSFSFIFIALGAALAALTALRTGWPAQVATFVTASAVSVLFVRPRLVEKLHSGKKIVSRTDALLGQEGIVSEAIDPPLKNGRVSVNGQDWSAQSKNALPAGSKIIVDGADGIVLLVREL